MKLSFILIFLLASNSFGETVQELIRDTRKTDYQINWKYKGGEYLIFDCERDHYACVNADGFQNCQEERNFAIEIKAPKYPCVAFKKYDSKKLCVVKNYEVVERNVLKRFCYP